MSTESMPLFNDGAPIWEKEPSPYAGMTHEQLEAVLREATSPPTPPPSDPVVAVDRWPEPMSDATFYGLAGDFVRLVLPETEGDPQALLLTFLVGFGCMLGREPYYQVEDTRHGVNLFTVIVGDTAKARKGTATDRTRRILTDVDSDFIETRLRSGLSSGEGLIQAVRDSRDDDVLNKDKGTVERQTVDAGETDKRLLVNESEFGSVLQQCSRDGNTLSAILRDAWDAKHLRVMARSNRDSCREPHISIIGNITIEELQRLLSTNDKANGLGNRFLWCCAKRSKLLPFGGQPLNESILRPLVTRLQAALQFGRNAGRVCFDADARAAWEHAYAVLSDGAGTGIFASMTARAEAQVIRLATLFALLDSTVLIRPVHLKAAQEVWSYCEDSVRHIFGDTMGDETADTILHLLALSPEGVSQSEISQAFGRNKSSAELSRALSLLEKKGKVSQRGVETGGRPKKVWVRNAT